MRNTCDSADWMLKDERECHVSISLPRLQIGRNYNLSEVQTLGTFKGVSHMYVHNIVLLMVSLSSDWKEYFLILWKWTRTQSYRVYIVSLHWIIWKPTPLWRRASSNWIIRRLTSQAVHWRDLSDLRCKATHAAYDSQILISPQDWWNCFSEKQCMYVYGIYASWGTLMSWTSLRGL